jgi:uncharacterized protein (TIGR02466 family)
VGAFVLDSSEYMTIRVKKEFAFTFATIVLERHFAGVEALNQRLSAKILEREAAGPGLVKSNVGGWHSAGDFLRWEGPESAELFQHVASAVKDYAAVERRVDAAALDLTVSAEAWANVARAGHYSKPHVHPNSNVSCVYYVDAGNAPADDANSGVIEFIDPRNRPSMFATEGTVGFDAYKVTPQSGLLLMFPAWLYHYVHPYQGTAPRISVAFNLTIQKLNVTAPSGA